MAKSSAERMRDLRAKRSGVPSSGLDWQPLLNGGASLLNSVARWLDTVTNRHVQSVTFGDDPLCRHVTALPPHAPQDKISISKSLEYPENQEKAPGDLTRETVTEKSVTNNVTSRDDGDEADPVPAPLESETRRVNATADGAFGGAVSAWAEGIRSITGKPFMVPAGGSSELSKLVMAIVTCEPDMAKRIDWARKQGAEFARTNKGKLSAHSFVDWLNSPPPVTGVTRRVGDGPADPNDHYNSPEEVRRRERVRDRRDAQHKSEAVPAPVGALLAAIGAGPPKAGGGTP